MKSGLVIHPLTKRYLDSAIKHPYRNRLLVGAAGSGKYSLVRYIVDGIGHVSEANILHLQPNKTLGIEDVRSVKNNLKLKSSTNRYIIIENIDKMTIEAQNSFLKILEESPNNTVFLATTAFPSALLSTVTSRFEQIPVHKPLKQQILDYIVSHSTSDNSEKYYALSDGNMGLLSAIVQNQNHYLLDYISHAKSMLQNDYFNRLLMIDAMTDKKYDIDLFFKSLQILIKTGMALTSVSGGERYTKWLELRKKLQQYSTINNRNPQPKLMLSALFLEM